MNLPLLSDTKLSIQRKAAVSGFSLLEMLVVVAGVAILAASVVTSFSPVWNESREAADRRNAQDLAALSASAEAFGADAIVPGNLMASISNLVNGVTVPANAARPAMVFKLPIGSSNDVSRAARYLALQGGVIEYHPDTQAAP